MSRYGPSAHAWVLLDTNGIFFPVRAGRAPKAIDGRPEGADRIEALYAPTADPVTMLVAEEAIRALGLATRRNAFMNAPRSDAPTTQKRLGLPPKPPFI